jgi:hypothetical protein
MAIFNIDSNVVFDSIQAALDARGVEMTFEMVQKIYRTIDNSLPELTSGLLEETYEEWREEAIGAKGWGTKYVQAIQIKQTDDGGKVYLDEGIMDKGSNKPAFMFAMMMERGVKSWSIKDALLNSEKAKVGPAGIKYIIVPFPVATPSAGKGGAKLASKFGGRKMSKDMHSLVKKGESVPEGTTISVTNTLRSFDVDVTGLTRYSTRKLHSQYGIFRCVSQKSTGWIFPDTPAEPIFPSVVEYVSRRIQEELKKYCDEIVKEFS